MVGADMILMSPVTFLWLGNFYSDKLFLEGMSEKKLKQYSKLKS